MAIRDYHPDQIEFYGTLGQAIVSWAHVERALYFVFASTLGRPFSNVPSAAFFSVINFSAKLAMVDNAMTVRYDRHPDVLARWTTLKNRLNRLSKRRNHMAHFQLLVQVRKDEYYHRLVPQLADPTPLFSGVTLEYDTARIEEEFHKFNKIAGEINELADFLDQTPLPEFDEQEEDHR